MIMHEKEFNNKDYVVVIGAANIDIGGTPYKELIKADSNPGVINISYGGVGRNIAENLSRLGVNTVLIAAVGCDDLGEGLVNHCKAAGINTDYILRDNKNNSSLYLYINDLNNDMAIALSDVNIAESLTSDYLDSLTDVINNAKFVIVDCNITQEALIHIKKNCRVPVYVDPVSQSHASKIKNNLNGIDTIKPNRLEAEYLSGISINTDEDYIRAADIFMKTGIRRVFISMGSGGLFAASEGNYYIVEKYPAEVLSTTGAGDSATAAIVWSSLKDDRDIINASRAANAAASMNVSSEKTINPDFSEERLLEMLDEDSKKSIMTIRKLIK